MPTRKNVVRCRKARPFAPLGGGFLRPPPLGVVDYSRDRLAFVVTRITHTGWVRTGVYTVLARHVCKPRLFMTFGNAMNNPG